MIFTISTIAYIVCGIYMLLNFKFDLQMLQQNSYRINRYWKWQKNKLADGSRLVDIALLMLVLSILLTSELSLIIVAITFIIKIIRILSAKYKKPLVFTKRIWRLYTVTSLLALAIFGIAIYADFDVQLYKIPVITVLIMSIFSWMLIILSVIVLKPVESAINRKYYNSAANILKSMPDLKIIGITGSFGKTSTKHYLYRILSEHYDVLMTPGSYNTPMGVIRTIREQMKPYNQIFICEMGAKQIGDIKEICNLVHPHAGIVTAVGEMHLESFKSIVNVQKTKFELIDALSDNGFAVINNDFEYCKNREVENVNNVRYSTISNDTDFYAANIKYTSQGTEFTINGPNNLSISLTTRLVGECNISNIVAAVAMAIYFKVPVDKIKYAVSQIEQVEHRLNIKTTPGGVNIIDDAFNSNPTGSKMAVDLLEHYKNGKRIIVTPGMIELGTKQYDLNYEFGAYLPNKTDLAIIVGQYNRKAIVSGYESTCKDNKNLHIVDSFADAQKLLATLLTSGDTILYENDLPDTFK